jgi:hypothetical protein
LGFRLTHHLVPEISGARPLTPVSKNRRHAMRILGYITAITMAAAASALGLLAVRSAPDVRQYLKIRKM